MITVSHEHRTRLRNAAILCFLFCATLLLAMLYGCANKNLTGIAKVNQQLTLSISDACTVAVQAKAAYEAGTIPQTDSARHAINDAGAACEDAKKAFAVALTAESAYKAAEAAQVNACTPTPGSAGETNVDLLPGCKSSTAAATAAKAQATNANAAFATAMDTLNVKAAAVKPLLPKS